jgi:hypothetical protein
MSKTIYTHKHHIIPRHAGGSDDPSNIVELSIPEHAEAHRKLFEEHGRWQDEVAWLTLSGQIDCAEAIKQAQIRAHKDKPKSEEHKRKLSEKLKGRKLSEATKKKMSESRKGKNNHFYGKKHTEETKKNIGKAGIGNTRASGKRTEESKRKMSISQMGNQNARIQSKGNEGY